MKIEIVNPSSVAQTVGVDDVVLARHIPAGDGSLTYLCTASHSIITIPLTPDEVMAAVFAGANPIDLEAIH